MQENKEPNIAPLVVSTVLLTILIISNFVLAAIGFGYLMVSHGRMTRIDIAGLIWIVFCILEYFICYLILMCYDCEEQ